MERRYASRPPRQPRVELLTPIETDHLNDGDAATSAELGGFKGNVAGFRASIDKARAMTNGISRRNKVMGLAKTGVVAGPGWDGRAGRITRLDRPMAIQQKNLRRRTLMRNWKRENPAKDLPFRAEGGAGRAQDEVTKAARATGRPGRETGARKTVHFGGVRMRYIEAREVDDSTAGEA
jgi:hypothetical protein